MEKFGIILCIIGTLGILCLIGYNIIYVLFGWIGVEIYVSVLCLAIGGTIIITMD